LPNYICASGWTHTELTALKVEIQDVDEVQFFGQGLMEFPEELLHTFYTTAQHPPPGVAIDHHSALVFGELTLMTDVPRQHRQEVSIDDLLHHLLFLMIESAGADHLVIGTQNRHTFSMAGRTSHAVPILIFVVTEG